MTSKKKAQKLSLKKPYSLRRLNETNSTNRNVDSSWTNPDESDDDDEQIVDYIDNIAIYSFSNMRKLKNFYTQNQLKLAENNLVASQDERMNKYLKKLDDNLSSNHYLTAKKQEEIVWQPNIKKIKSTKSELENSSFSRSSSTLSEDSMIEKFYDDLPKCGKAHCKLGCICDPLLDIELTDNYSSDPSEKRLNKLERNHCGRVECMFVCNCTRKLRRKTAQNNSKEINDKKPKQQQSVSTPSKKSDEMDENRRMSKRIKSAAICQSYRTNSENDESTKPKSKNRSKSILNSSIVSSKSNSSNYECTRSSSEESQVNKQSGINSSSDETDLNQTAEPVDEPTTRKSKRVKQLNKKFVHDMDTNQTPSSFNDFYYYSTNKHLKPTKNKVLNNRLNEGHVPKKEKQQKSLKAQKAESLKETSQVDENKELVKNEDERESEVAFKPYTKNVSLKITNTCHTKNADRFTKMPLTIHVFTNLWESHTQLRMKALRQIAKLLQNNVTTWTNLEFECDLLTIKLSNADPVLVKVSKSQKAQGCVNNKPVGSILSLNDIVSTSYRIRSKLIHNEPENISKQPQDMTWPALQACSYQQSINAVKPLQNQLNHPQQRQQQIQSPTKSLPRLISRNRSHKQLETNNKTGILLKQVDSLFKQMKTSQENHLGSITQPDKFDKISPAVLSLRKEQELTEYNPFSDTELILGMYKSNESRGTVDTVCCMVNDMVTACCKLEEKHKQSMLEKSVITLSSGPINLGQKTNIIDLKKNSNPAAVAKYPVTLTTIKKTLPEPNKPIIHTFTPSITNTTSGHLNKAIKLKNYQPCHKTTKSLVYQIISSNDPIKKQNLIQLIRNEQKNNSSTGDNQRPNVQSITNDTTQQVSTFKFDNSEAIATELNNTEPKTPVVQQTKEEPQISTIKSILPSSTIGTVKYKTLVKIVTPEKNNPEGGPKIKISSSYVMPAHSCIPGVNKSSNDQNITVPKLIKMAMDENKKLIVPSSNNKYLSSFVPIRPKQQQTQQHQDSQSNQSGYLKSIVCPIPIVLPAENRLKLINNSRFGGFRQATSVFKTTGHESTPGPKQSAVITLVAPNGNQKITDINSNYQDANVGPISTLDAEEQAQLKYIEIRKRKRKQDLSNLKNQHYTSLNSFDMNQQSLINQALMSERLKKDQLASELEMKSSHALISSNQFKSSFENKLENVFKFQRMPLLLKNRRKRDTNSNQSYYSEQPSSQPTYLNQNQSYQNIPKNFSSSPDSNESLYSTSNLLPNEQSYYDHKSAFVTYKEDSDEDCFDTNCSTYKFDDFNEHDLEPIDNDVIEIDSEPSNDNEHNNQMDSLLKRSFDEFQPSGDLNEYYLYDNEYNLATKKYKQSTENDSDSSDSSLPVITFSSKGLEKSTINNIHSIRERQRRLKLKTLLMKLKIQLFECESQTKYDLDNSVSQKKLDEYCNTRNFNKKSLKSKQNILQEAVNLIKNLQNEQSSLELMMLEQKLELEKNVGIRNYLMKLNSSP